MVRSVAERSPPVTQAQSMLTNCNGRPCQVRVQSRSFGVRSNKTILTRKGEKNVKRLILALVTGALLAASLSGCIVVPDGGYHHHGYYYR
jgi:hypothetical protein